ncbi:hypothetical protein QAD02_010334 [Eretmocerus hayati]|uniref:Uncharacterized protein n=1 Tax=Eretmocerus hayati TaxID=131215 RepID=A0ACC2NCM3_9HYME|nr:hypothetical protein QAD02_010334 [Eretmocerus hayati]
MKFPIFCLLIHIILLKGQIIADAEPIAGPDLRLAKPHEFSFVVAIEIRLLGTGEYAFCTGSIISKNHVLTVAHCVRGDEEKRVEVLAGSHNLNQCKRYRVATWVTYEMWAKKYHKTLIEDVEVTNDIAVLILAEKIVLSRMKKATFSQKRTEKLYGLDARMVGWKTDSRNSETSLYNADVTILTREACYDFNNLLKKEVEYIPKSFLCAIAEPYVIGNKGDSGAPLVYKDKKILGVLRGISPDDNAAAEGLNIFTSIDPYKEFIYSFLNG